MSRAGSGDKLASGGIRATFQTTDGSVTADRWSQAFDDFNPEEYNGTKRGSSAVRQESGNVSPRVRKSRQGKKPA